MSLIATADTWGQLADIIENKQAKSQGQWNRTPRARAEVVATIRTAAAHRQPHVYVRIPGFHGVVRTGLLAEAPKWQLDVKEARYGDQQDSLVAARELERKASIMVTEAKESYQPIAMAVLNIPHVRDLPCQLGDDDQPDPILQRVHDAWADACSCLQQIKRVIVEVGERGL